MSLKFCHLIRNVLIAPSARCMSFKSDLSLDKIYPASTNVRPFNPPENKNGRFSGFIPVKELSITYTLASGPGGQHANKRCTKADIRFHVNSAVWLSDNLKQKLYEKYPTKITKDGFLVVRSERTREALANQLDAMTKLREILYEADRETPTILEESLEKLRKQKEKAVRLRLMEKRRTSLIKRARCGDLN